MVAPIRATYMLGASQAHRLRAQKSERRCAFWIWFAGRGCPLLLSLSLLCGEQKQVEFQGSASRIKFRVLSVLRSERAC
jgi:hypothetical protein